ncbi:MAG: DNA gyrase inhibitor YacG [Proteobacteria bacterium]|nr:DNA gyrase inhibitor YacG [Pseudomonadota bacterium]
MNKKTVKCPICEKQTVLGPSNAYRPFCSERCRLIDLGQWFEESYTVSEPVDINDDLSDIERKH